jgi:hypothetical protein
VNRVYFSSPNASFEKFLKNELFPVRREPIELRSCCEISNETPSLSQAYRYSDFPYRTSIARLVRLAGG